MPSRDEKARRKGLAHALRDRQRQKTREGFPAPVIVLKQLFDNLDLRLSDEQCDGSLRFTRECLRRGALDEDRIIDWLGEHGAHCDCEVLGNVEPVVSEALPGYERMADETGSVN